MFLASFPKNFYRVIFTTWCCVLFCVFFLPLYLVKFKVFDFLFTFIYLKTLFILAMVDLGCCGGFSLVAGSGGYSLVAGSGATP